MRQSFIPWQERIVLFWKGFRGELRNSQKCWILGKYAFRYLAIWTTLISKNVKYFILDLFIKIKIVNDPEKW